MSLAHEAFRKDRLAMGACFVAAAAEIGMRQLYFQFGSELAHTAVVSTAAVLLAVVSYLLQRLARPGLARAGSRALLVVAFGVAGHLAVWPMVARHLAGAGGIVLGVVVVALVWLVCRASDAGWARWRRALAVLTLVFVGSQPVIAWLAAPHRTWPGPVTATAAGARPVATLALLFDELNAGEAGPFEEVLARHGLVHVTKRIDAIDRNTAEVVPAMFGGGQFHDAKVCSLTAICSGSRVVDFARITASRPDIDVVGFYHPYCAMQGLRSCVRPPLETRLTDLDRWRCAFWKRMPWGSPMRPEACGDVLGQVWESIRVNVREAVLAAPALTRGGLLFAHLPLPHPPGPGEGRTLAQDYRANVARAAALLDEMLTTAERSGVAVQLVLFSDHPLRQAHWCGGIVQYAGAGCTPDASLEDDHVPLIVAAGPDTPLPSLAGIHRNDQVFSVVGAWPRR